jgi:hypothetical protein
MRCSDGPGVPPRSTTGLDHGVGHPLLLPCNAKAPNYRKNKALNGLATYSKWPKVADAVINAAPPAVLDPHAPPGRPAPVTTARQRGACPGPWCPYAAGACEDGRVPLELPWTIPALGSGVSVGRWQGGRKRRRISGGAGLSLGLPAPKDLEHQRHSIGLWPIRCREPCSTPWPHSHRTVRVSMGCGGQSVAGGMATPSSYGAKGRARNAEALRLRRRCGRPAAAGGACGARQAWDAARRAARTLGEAWRWPWTP